MTSDAKREAFSELVDRVQSLEQNLADHEAQIGQLKATVEKMERAAGAHTHYIPTKAHVTNPVSNS